MFNRLVLVFAALVLAGPAVWAADLLGSDFQFSGYFRGPLGSSLGGGREIQLTNPGSFGNEFRLGNEMGYGELNFMSRMVKASSDTGVGPIDGIFTLAINPPMNTQYNDNANGNGTTQVVQAFVIGKFDNGAGQYWAGKRFYRWGYVIMDDFFYFADMSGNGVGVEQISTPIGEFAIALEQFTDTTVNGTNGNPSKEALDLRLKKVELGTRNNLDFWYAFATTGSGTGTTTTNGTTTVIDYRQATGSALGIRWNHIFDNSINELSVQIGTGSMEGLTLNTDAAVTADAADYMRIRFVNNWDTPIADHWALRSGLVYDDLRYDPAGHSQRRWSSIGLKPSYILNDHWQILLEGGYSEVTDDADAKEGARTLTRVSLGPQVGIGKGLAANPLIRATISSTSWNGANADATDVNSLVGQYVANNPNSKMLTGVKHLEQVGVEVEMSF